MKSSLPTKRPRSVHDYSTSSLSSSNHDSMIPSTVNSNFDGSWLSLNVRLIRSKDVPVGTTSTTLPIMNIDGPATQALERSISIAPTTTIDTTTQSTGSNVVIDINNNNSITSTDIMSPTKKKRSIPNSPLLNDWTDAFNCIVTTSTPSNGKIPTELYEPFPFIEYTGTFDDTDITSQSDKIQRIRE